jgi:Ca2+-binding RTX toxin-like protein
MNCERLESRRLFAVDVAVTGGVLTITGDEAANLVSVHLTGEDTLVVRTGTEVVDDTTTTPTDGATGTTAAAACPGRVDFGELTTTEFDISDEGITSILMDLGDGNDVAHIAYGVELAATINGGAGNDKLGGGEGDDTINGDDGNDLIRGGEGADILNGGAGNDFILAADGESDTIDGGDDATDADGTSGDVAVIDDADGTTPDAVSNVESTRVGGDGFGFGRPGFGFGGRHGGPHHAPPADDGTGTTDAGTAVTTTAVPTVLNVFGVNRRVNLMLRR